MRKSALLLLILIALAACTRSVGPITEPSPTETETTSVQPSPQFTLSPQPSATSTSEPKPSATATSAQPAATQPPPATNTSQAPTQAPATQAPTETPVRTPTATLPPFDPRASLGSPTFRDPMDANSFRNWSRDNKLPDNENISLVLEEGQLEVTGKKPYFDTWWFSWPFLADFYLEMKVNTGECSGRDSYGLIFRGPPRDYGDTYGYQTVFTCDGQYQVRRVDTATPYVPVELTPWTSNVNIPTGQNQVVRMGVMADGSKISLYANGFKVAEVTDSKFREGRYGVFVSAADTFYYTYFVDEIAYWELE